MKVVKHHNVLHAYTIVTTLVLYTVLYDFFLFFSSGYSAIDIGMLSVSFRKSPKSRDKHHMEVMEWECSLVPSATNATPLDLTCLMIIKL